MSRKRVLLGLVVGSLVATAALAIGILLFSSFDQTSGKILATTFFVSLASLLALPGAALLDQRRLAPLGAVTIALALGELAIATAGVWSGNETVGKLAGSGLAVTIAGVQTSALAGERRAGGPAAIRPLFAAATVAAATGATLVVVAIWVEPSGTAYLRATGAVIVADVLLAILQPVLARGSAAVQPSVRMHRLRLTLDDGSTVEEELAGGTFADAAARAIRAAERDGRRVRTLERLDS